MKQQSLISRRKLLRAGGATLALPLLESLLPRAKAADLRPPVRFGIFTVTGGTVVESWRPEQTGPLEKLPSILRPLESLKKEVLVVSGLAHAGRSDNLNGHEHCAVTHLTGAPLAKREGGKLFASISVDQAAAQVLGKETLLPSLEIGLVNQETRYSFRSRDMNVPYEANPRLIFDRMFRGRQPVVPNWQRRAAAPARAGAAATADSLDRSVLDLVLDQARDLRRDLGRTDRAKLDQYLESVRSVEKRIEFVEARQQQDVLDLASPGPSKLDLPHLPKAGTQVWEISGPIHADPSRHGDYIRLLADMMVLAFQTDATRVLTLAAGSDEAMFPGVVTVGYERHCHTLEHQGNAARAEDADPIAREACRQIHAWYTQLFAETLAKMKAIDEGGSSLLDNSVVLFTSYMADGGHGRHDYPVLLAGRAGGALQPGRHVGFARQAPMANLFVELLNLLGAATKTFGDSHTSQYAGDLDGRLPGVVS